MRKKFETAMFEEIKKLKRDDYIDQTDTMSSICEQSFKHLCRYAKLPRGIAWTKSLKESFWSIVVAIHTRIPLLMTGPAGIGKTLSYQIVADNLTGSTNRHSEVFKHLKRCVVLVKCFNVMKIQGQVTLRMHAIMQFESRKTRTNTIRHQHVL